MRIRPRPAQPTQRSADKGGHAYRKSVRLLLIVALVAALLIVAGIWYGAEGHQVVDPLLAATFAQEAVEPNDLPTLYLHLGANDYRAMARQRFRAVQTGILQLDGEGWREAHVQFQEDEIPIRIRLKGDEPDHTHPANHWQTDKWSFQVEVQDGASILGMQSFSLQSPATRAYLNEWLYTQSLRQVGILAPRYTFVNLSVNGRTWGIYALEEAPSRTFLASQQRREGVVVRRKTDLLWDHRDRDGGSSAEIAEAPYSVPAFAQMDVLYASGRDENDAASSGQAVDALGLLLAYQGRQLAASQVFDAELLGRYIAHAHLWGARTEPASSGEHYYYDPSTARLEPVAYDARPLALAHAGFARVRFDDLAVVEAYAGEVRRLSQPEYLEELASAYGSEFSRYRAALLQEFFAEHLQPPWDALAERQARLHALLHPAQTVHAFQSSARWDGEKQRSTIDVQVGNLLRYPVVLQQVRLGQRSVDVQAGWIVEAGGDVPLHTDALPAVVLRQMQGAVPRYVTLRIPTTALSELFPRDTPPPPWSGTLQLVTSLVGVDDQVIVDVQTDRIPALSEPVLPGQPSVQEALERHSFLAPADQPGLLALRPGTWHVSGDLVLPDGVGLWATEAVTLAFDRQAMLFSTAPLLLHCPDGERIHFGPQDGHWAGIVVLDAGPQRASSLYNVEIRGIRGVRRGGWTAPGGITFYQSPVVMNNCQVLDSFAPAALSVVRAELALLDTEFGSATGDAFAGDSVQGQVARCAIHDVLGNGIDLSGGEVTIEDTSLLRVHDTAILAGQGSRVTARAIRAHDVGIAVASKDASSVRAADVRIEEAWIAGFAAYGEGMVHGLAGIQATEVSFNDQSVQALVQEGSSATINGVAIPAQALEISTLRRPSETSPPMQPLDYRFGSAIWLRGYEITTPQVAPGQRVQFVLYWRTFEKLDRQYTVFVHVLDASGETVAGWDSMPRHNSFPTTDWPLETLIDDPRFVPLSQDLPAGEYRIALGMYYWATGVRLPVQTGDGQEVPDARIILDQAVTVK